MIYFARMEVVSEHLKSEAVSRVSGKVSGQLYHLLGIGILLRMIKNVLDFMGCHFQINLS